MGTSICLTFWAFWKFQCDNNFLISSTCYLYNEWLYSPPPAFFLPLPFISWSSFKFLSFPSVIIHSKLSYVVMLETRLMYSVSLLMIQILASGCFISSSFFCQCDCKFWCPCVWYGWWSSHWSRGWTLRRSVMFSIIPSINIVVVHFVKKMAVNSRWMWAVV